MSETNEEKKQKTEVIKEVLSYWKTMDFLEQDAFPRLSEEESARATRIKEQVSRKTDNKKTDNGEKGNKKGLQRTLKIRADGESLYEMIKNCAKEYGMCRWGNITIYIGKVKRECCTENIARTLQEAENNEKLEEFLEKEFVEKNIEKIAWASLQVGSDLVFVEDSFSLSPVIWAMHQLAKDYGTKSCSEILSKGSHETVETAYNNDLKSIFREGKTKKEKEKGESAKKIDDYELDDRKEYIKENAYSLKKKKLLEVRDYLYRTYLEEYIKMDLEKEIDPDIENDIWITFKLYKNDEDWNLEKEEEYRGLSKRYFVSDLDWVLANAENLESGSHMHQKLADYIYSKYNEDHGAEHKGRVNLLEEFEKGDDISGYKDLLLDILDPGDAPMGKWPSRYMPAFMQQVAINLGINEENTIFSVNGPPGTGKTTLLKEIVAHNVVERAKLLAEYSHPDDAFEHLNFEGGTKCTNGSRAYADSVHQYHKWKNDKINDYSIVVASCNNTAVENITKEFPMEKKITNGLEENTSDSKSMRSELKEIREMFTVSQNNTADGDGPDGSEIYFTKYAKNLFGEGAWGLIAAPLGRKKNINIVYNQVLEKFKFEEAHWSSVNRGYKEYSDKKKLKEQEYYEVRRKFKRQLAVVTDMQNKLKHLSEMEKGDKRNKLQKQKINLQIELEKLYKRVKKDTEKEKEWQEALSKSETECSMKFDQYQEAEKRCSDSEKKHSDCYQRYMEAEKERGELHVSFISKMLKMKKAREAEEKYEFLSQRMNFFLKEMEAVESGKEEMERECKEKKQQYAQMQEEKIEKENELEKLKAKAEGVKRKFEETERELAQCSKAIDKLKQEYASYVNDMVTEDDTNRFRWLNDKFVENLSSGEEAENTEAQIENPWFYQKYNREREKLFYISLRLQEAFILASRSCKQNILSLCMYWKKLQNEDDKWVIYSNKDINKSLGAMFQTLFLFIPVISTTFASMGSFFRDIGAESIGTLIIDEAGQAVPYMAVGALYRARKAIIVGDPRQIEPVVTDDLRFIRQAYKKDPVCRSYISKDMSVQTFADSLNKYGTWLEPYSEKPEWVGCPLVVHRRCIAPMFEISNELSYNNIMKQKTGLPSKEEQEKFIYPESRWIVVKGNEMGNKNHFVENQADKVLDMLEIAIEKGEENNIYIISPFKTVVTGMKNRLNYAKKRRPSLKIFMNEEWIKGHIGTVHTFQGKEANEVIFLLGCDNRKQSEGAVKWVARNIVNVAVTRAKYRLYVVGDDEVWKHSGPLKTVLKNLKKF